MEQQSSEGAPQYTENAREDRRKEKRDRKEKQRQSAIWRKQFKRISVGVVVVGIIAILVFFGLQTSEDNDVAAEIPIYSTDFISGPVDAP